jgi:hypothetical protein
MDCRATPKQRSWGVHQKAYAGGPLEAAMRGAQVGIGCCPGVVAVYHGRFPVLPSRFLGANFVRLRNAVLLHEQDSARGGAIGSAKRAACYPYLDCSSAPGSDNAVPGRR